MSHAAPEAAAAAPAASSGSAEQRIPSSLLERRHFSTKSNRESEQKEQGALIFQQRTADLDLSLRARRAGCGRIR
jgi:hypothetical protein